jgi:hypothetical protein
MAAALGVRILAALTATVSFLPASGARPARAEDATGHATVRTPPRYAIHIAHEPTAGALQRVLDGARERLSDPRCQQVLDDFRDGDGHSLRARLEETGRTPEDYFALIVFYDGRKQPRCRQKGILAVTSVGNRIVYVCPEELYTKAITNPVWAEATLIHEALHTLGLGENPPSSREITSQVMRRCRR